MYDCGIVGTSVSRTDGLEKVTGRSVYVGDLELPGMLHGKILRSLYPHARVLHVDARRAEALPGVHAVLTREDLKGQPNVYYGPIVRDQPVVAIDKVLYVGDPVAAVAAEREEIALEALDLIAVEYEELPVVEDLDAALAPGAPLMHERSTQPKVVFADIKSLHLGQGSNLCSISHLRKGDVEEGFRQAALVVEDTYTMPMVQHGHIEPHGALAHWDRPDHLTIWSCTQNPSVNRAQLAELFGLPEGRVRLIVPLVGGGYGAKTYPKVEPITAWLARKAGRPVRVVLTREEVFQTIARHPSKVWIKTGVTRDGLLLARQVEARYDTGAYADIGPRTTKNGGYVSPGPYRIDHVSVDSLCIYTNKTPAGAFRGFGVPQVAWNYECQMDDIAERLNMDPLELRLKNLMVEGDRFHTGEELFSVGMKECLEAVARDIVWEQRDAAYYAARRHRPRVGRLRGKGLAVIIKSTMTPSLSTASLRLDADGSATVMTSTVEIGQGCGTVLAQIAAEVLGVPVERVTVSLPDTDFTPYDQSTSSSRSVFSMGHCVLEAGKQIRDQLLALASEALEVSPEDLQVREAVVSVRGSPERSVTITDLFRRRHGSAMGSLFGNSSFQSTGGLDPDTGQGKASAFWHIAAGAAEVEVDCETGRVTVLQLVAALDTGKTINPLGCNMQNEGSVLTALGATLMEEMVFDRGQPLNGSFLEYNLPSMEDMPGRLGTILIEQPHPDGPFGAKGVGESSSVVIAPAIGNAVYDACGVRVKALPITPERILRGLREQTRWA